MSPQISGVSVVWQTFGVGVANEKTVQYETKHEKTLSNLCFGSGWPYVYVPI